MAKIDVARKRLWKILCETGDDINNSWDESDVMAKSMSELLEEAKSCRNLHYYGDDCDYEMKAVRKYERFIKRFEKE